MIEDTEVSQTRMQERSGAMIYLEASQYVKIYMIWAD